MKPTETLILLPCHSLEDFPIHYEGEQAEGLLANWTALWHPALLATTGKAPAWARVDDPPETLENRVLLVPSVSSSELPTGFGQRARDAGALCIRRAEDRQALVERLLSELELDSGPIDPDLVADFLALGYAYLQIQLLTRQMRYSSNLDELHFADQLVAAARAAAGGDTETARQRVTACFDLLAEERDHYYSVDTYLIDLTLVATSTLGRSLVEELERGQPTNVILTGELLEQMAERSAASLEALKIRLDTGGAGLIGGERDEGVTAMLPPESLLANLREAQAICQRLLGRTFQVYGRRTFGLTPNLPALLEKLGFVGALHAVFEEGRVPQGSQAKTRWEGLDGTAIEAIAKPPLDATRAETFLGLCGKLGETMDMDHVATLCFAHWPGRRSIWFDDLCRCCRFGTALGKFVTVEEYFRDTYMPGHQERFRGDQYRSPYLKQAVIRRGTDPLSSLQRPPRETIRQQSLDALGTLASAVSGDAGGPAELASACQRLVTTLAGREAASAPALWVLNPFTFARRVPVEVSQLERLPDVEKPIYAAGEAGEQKFALVDVPPMGFVRVVAGTGSSSGGRKGTPLLAEDFRPRDDLVVLRNEFFEAHIHPVTGTLQSVQDYASRGNRLSQQLALRQPGPRRPAGAAWEEPDAGAVYSVMAADRVEVTRASTVMGEVVARGRLLARNGDLHAGFVQTYRIWRGRRVIEVEIELDPQVELGSDPWNHYFACRLAWADETALLHRSVNQTSHEAEARRLEAPDFLELRSGDRSICWLPNGLPFHRRSGFRMLDTLLIVRHETARRFRLGVGLDVPNPLHEAWQLAAPDMTVFETSPPPRSGNSSWLFHLDARNVVATHWEPLGEEGRVGGVRVRLLETSGRPARMQLRGFRPLTAAHRLDFRGQSLGDCPIEDGHARLELAAHEWIELEAWWI